jgi:hypothetical protein
MRKIDLTFGWLMILGCIGHTLGTMKYYTALSDVWVWSLGTSLAGFILGALNVLRATRSPDKAVAAITLPGSAAFVLIAIGFGVAIHNLGDPRVIGNVVIATALALFSLSTLVKSVRTAGPA